MARRIEPVRDIRGAGRRSRVFRQAMILLAALWAARMSGAAVYDPSLEWQTIATEHFRIHFPRGLEEEAARLAAAAEEVHGPMVRIVGWEPGEPTEVTLVDRTDLANGFTTVFPYNQIVLYPVRPAMIRSVGDYDDWLKTVFVHEYAHVLGLDPVRGYSAVLRKIFGRVDVPMTPASIPFWFLAAPPNVFLPPWFHEGLATNLEGDLTGRGRKGSTYYRMIYRSDVAAGTIPPLDRLGGDFPEWPSYSTRYIYGARLLQVAEDRYGREGLGQLVRGHSGRFPYAIDEPPNRLTGGAYQALYREMTGELEREYRPEIERLQGEGLTPYETISASSYSSWGPLWVGEQSLVYTRETATTAALLWKDLDTGRERRLAARPDSISRPTVAGERLVYPRVEVYRPFAGGLEFTDLYSVDLEGGSEDRLTRGARIAEADYNSRMDGFAAVQLEKGRHRLVLLAPKKDEAPVRVLLEEPGVRYDSPRWSPDGARLAFSRKTDSGHARLAVLDVSTGTVQLLTPEGTQAGFPSWSPDGRRLAFAWDRSGVFDLYAFDVSSGTCVRLTRVVGGAFEPDWSPSGSRIAFSSYTASGFRISVLALDQALNDPVPAHAIEVLAASAETPGAPTPPGTVADYTPGKRLLPTFWLPDAVWDNEGIAPGIWTAGHDPLLRHMYFLAGYWAIDSQRAFAQGIYKNEVTYPSLTFRAWKLPIFYSDLFKVPGGDLDYWEQTLGAEAEARINLPRALRHWSAALAWAWEEQRSLSDTEDDLQGRDDLAQLPFEGRTNPLTVSVRYDSSFPHHTPFSVGAEGGRWVETALKVSSESLGAELDTQTLTAEWREYLAVPRLSHTVLALRGKGGIGWGDVPFQSLFQVGGVEAEFPLRGYAERVTRGEKAFVASAELRFPLWSPFRGIQDLPLFLRRVHAAPFFDAGRVWDGFDDEWRRGAGVELRMDTLLGYYLPTTLTAGAAYGFDDGGGARGYATFQYVY